MIITLKHWLSQLDDLDQEEISLVGEPCQYCREPIEDDVDAVIGLYGEAFVHYECRINIELLESLNTEVMTKH